MARTPAGSGHPVLDAGFRAPEPPVGPESRCVDPTGNRFGRVLTFPASPKNTAAQLPPSSGWLKLQVAGAIIPRMTDVPFDTMAALRRFEAKGFSSEQAEAITQTVRDGVTGGVATRADIAEVRADISELRTELRWMKLIGGAVLAVLVLPWLDELVSATMPG